MTFGTILRGARAAQGLRSRDGCATAAHPTDILRAIEEDDFSSMPPRATRATW
ncbi:MAG: helix-turn-helix domain-containing protein [Eggerthella lenta]